MKYKVALLLFAVPSLIYAQAAPVVLSCQVEGSNKPRLIKIHPDTNQPSWQEWGDEEISWSDNKCDMSHAGGPADGPTGRWHCDFSPGKFVLRASYSGGAEKYVTLWTDSRIDRVSGEYVLISMWRVNGVSEERMAQNTPDGTPSRRIGECRKAVEPEAPKAKF
ncbi:hypothetical protein [Luteimonas arsenica]|uniref:hypothetical protein n=1 Tax=Luteimonas arsenica TaxID=1586242 RepID=UPI00105527BD|nr:hypothetical protein [Luteimonas arsenica]